MKNNQQNFKNIQISEKYSNKKKRHFLYIALMALAVFIFIYLSLEFFNTKNAEISNLEKQINELKLIINKNKENKEQIALNSVTNSSNIFEIKNLLEAHNFYHHFSFSKLPAQELESFLNKHQNQLSENNNSFFIESENNNYFLTADRTSLYQIFLAEEDKLALEKFNINFLVAPIITDKIIENIPQLFEEMKEKTFNRVPNETKLQQAAPILLDNSLLSPNTAFENSSISENNLVYEDNTVSENNAVSENNLVYEDNTTSNNSVVHENNTASENSVVYEDNTASNNNFVYEDNTASENSVVHENNTVSSNSGIKYSQPEISKKKKPSSTVNLPGIFLENHPEEAQSPDNNITSGESLTIEEDLEALPINNSSPATNTTNTPNLPQANTNTQELNTTKPENTKAKFYQDADGTWRNAKE